MQIKKNIPWGKLQNKYIYFSIEERKLMFFDNKYNSINISKSWLLIILVYPLLKWINLLATNDIYKLMVLLIVTVFTFLITHIFKKQNDNKPSLSEFYYDYDKLDEYLQSLKDQAIIGIFISVLIIVFCIACAIYYYVYSEIGALFLYFLLLTLLNLVGFYPIRRIKLVNNLIKKRIPIKD